MDHWAKFPNKLKTKRIKRWLYLIQLAAHACDAEFITEKISELVTHLYDLVTLYAMS